MSTPIKAGDSRRGGARHRVQITGESRVTLAEQLHQRAAELRAAAQQERVAARGLSGSDRNARLHRAILIMREAGATLRRARRIAKSLHHGGTV